jgi:hypothetical protein
MSNTDIAIRQVGPKAAIKAVTKALSKRRPLFLWGAPGIGKSEIMQFIGNTTDREVIDIRLPLWEPTDIKGMPFYNPEKGAMEWAPPVELPVDADSKAIIFLDELNAAPPAVQAAAYQLVLNRRVGTYVLPKGVDIVAAGNRDSDRGVTYRMPKPLANRFLHLEMKPDFDDWFDWATLNKVHEDVVGYLGFAKQDLFDFDPKSSSHAFATPRSWSFVSDLLDDDDLDSDTLMDLVSGAVGDGLAVKFMAHRKIAGKLPKADDILDGKVKDLEIKEVSAMYSLTVSLCYELKDRAEKKAKEWDAMADRFFRYMMDNFPTELVVMGAKTALTNYNLPLDANKMESFDEFHNRFGKYVVNAMENS